MTELPLGDEATGTVASRINQAVPHSARIWNYWLGGKDNFESDRSVGDSFANLYPDITTVALSSRAFLVRAVTYLAGEVGIRQFLDIGTGLPTGDNTHEVAQRVAPESRIVYVDNDPMVLAHARALLTSSVHGVTSYIDADLHDPAKVLAEARELLDFSQPVALMLLNILGHVPELEQARTIVRTLLAALPSGSHLVTADGTNVLDGPAFEAAIQVWNDNSTLPYHLRHPDELAQYLEGLDVVEPGLVPCARWRPTSTDPADLRPVDEYGAVARKR